MIETVASAGLAVDEQLEIKKNRLQPEHRTGAEKRICLVTGTHGDELEGQYVCWQVIRTIQEHMSALHGIVDVYPALNPLGIDCMSRGIPMFDLDMNRIFPGSETNHMAEWTANHILNDMKGADLCIDIHASNVYLREVPQARISEQSAPGLLPYAKQLNVDYIWIHEAATVLESTLAYSLNAAGTPALVVEMGIGLRITEAYCRQLTDGIFYLMRQMGIWDGPCPQQVRTPAVSSDGHVSIINAGAAGIFVPRVDHWNHIKKGEHIGDILDPLHGEVRERISSPADGMVVTLREHPIVMEGALIARIFEGAGYDG